MTSKREREMKRVDDNKNEMEEKGEKERVLRDWDLGCVQMGGMNERARIARVIKRGGGVVCVGVCVGV